MPSFDMPSFPHLSLLTLVASAVFIGIISVLLFNKQIAKSIRLFREGFDRHLLWTYWGLFKEKGWELFWGPTILGIIFCVSTLWHSPTLTWFLTYLLVVCFMTGYYLWRDGYEKLQPKFKVEKIIAQRTDTEVSTVTRIFLQVLPECVAEAPVLECRARLLLVSQRNTKGEWVPTEMNSPLKMDWDYYGHEPLAIEPGIGQRLNICWWDNHLTGVIPSVYPMPSKWRSIIGPGTFKFDIRMSAKHCAPIDFYVTVNLLGTKWDDQEFALLKGKQNGK